MTPDEATTTVLTLAVASATCAIAAHHHTQAYRRTAALAQDLFDAARRDSLTGLLNPCSFHARLPLEVAAQRHGLTGRLGGDEFALLLPATPTGTAVAVADRLRDDLRSRAASYRVTVSVGVATSTAPGGGADLMAAADRALPGEAVGPGPQRPHAPAAGLA